MIARRVSVVLSGRDLESLLEGLDREEASVSRLQGACIGGLELPRLYSRRAELRRLQGALVEAFAAGVDCGGERIPSEAQGFQGVLSSVPDAGSGSGEALASPVEAARVLSAVEVAVPCALWEAVCSRVSEAEGVLRSLMGEGRLDRLWAHDFLSSVEALRRKWRLPPPVVSAVDEEVDVVRDSCPGCGLAFERPLSLASGSLCPACVEERARGDQA